VEVAGVEDGHGGRVPVRVDEDRATDGVGRSTSSAALLARAAGEFGAAR
jgi:adenine-specific DNA glycosylase